MRYTKRYIVRRVTNLIVTFVVVLLINFMLPRLMPGNFVDIYVAQLQQDGVVDVNVNQLKAEFASLLGTNKPLFVQFIDYVRNVVFSFPPKFGPSFEYYPLPAVSLVLGALKWTLLLLGSSQAIAWTCGAVIGTFLALNRGGIIDKALGPTMVSMLTIPPFWLGTIFILVFAVDLKVLPPVGAFGSSLTASSVFTHMILPMSVIIIATLPSHVIVIRNTAVEVLSSDHIKALQAQGVSKRSLLFSVMRNSFLPSLTQLFLSIGWLFGGIYVVEYTFSYPGVGTIIANAVFARDYPVLQAGLYITALAVILANFAADMIYPLVDPRVTYTR